MGSIVVAQTSLPRQELVQPSAGPCGIQMQSFFQLPLRRLLGKWADEASVGQLGLMGALISDRGRSESTVR